MKVCFDSARAYNFLGFQRKHTRTFSLDRLKFVLQVIQMIKLCLCVFPLSVFCFRTRTYKSKKFWNQNILSILQISIDLEKLFVCVFSEILRSCTRERNQNKFSILSGLKENAVQLVCGGILAHTLIQNGTLLYM